MKAKFFLRSLCFSAITALSGMSAADDIDIYLSTANDVPAGDVSYWPVVMFSFDITSNANATSCQVDVTYTPPAPGTYTFTTGSADCQLLIDKGVLNKDSVAGLPVADAVAWSLNNYAINRHEVYGMALRVAIEEVVGPNQGLRVGMMLPHEQEADTAQSNGGYIPLGFGPTQQEVNTAAGNLDCTDDTLSSTDEATCRTAAFNLRDARFAKFTELAVNTSELLRGNHGGIPPQNPSLLRNGNDFYTGWAGAEMYLELYRYVKGARTYRADLGWIDFGSESTSNSLNPQPDASIVNDWTLPDPAYASNYIANKFYTVAWDTDIIALNKISGNNVNKTYIKPELKCSGVNVINFLHSQSSVHEPTKQGGNKDTSFYNTLAEGSACTDPTVCGVAVTLNGEVNAESSPNDVTKAVWRRMNGIDLLTGVNDPEGVQGFTSYLIVNSSNPSQADLALAEAGGGVAYAAGSSVQDLIDAIKDALLRILTDSTTFTAPALTANALNRTDILNDVFLALFNADTGPFWPGNVKKLRLAVNSLGDDIVAGVPSIGAGGEKNFINAFQNGLIAADVTSYWTDVPLPTGIEYNDEATDATDGRMVPRGGAGQQIPGTRTIYTENSGSLVTFNTTTAPTLTTAQVNYIYNPAYAYAAGQTWKMGSTLHSRPAAINYGLTTAQRVNRNNPDVRIVFGSNDGTFRMLKNTNDTTDDIELNGNVQSGVESWAFIPQEAYQAIPRLREEVGAGISYPGIPITVDGPPLVTQVDGNGDGMFTPTADWDVDGNGTVDPGEVGAVTGDIVWGFFGLRRGGKYYYAMNLLNPDSPQFMWKIGKNTSGATVKTYGGGPGDSFNQMAQAWSTPQFGVMRVKTTNLPGNLCSGGATECNVPILAFGGGYNGDDFGLNGTNCTTPTAATALAKLGDDAVNRGCSPNLDAESDDDEGNAVFIVHAQTGALIWKLVKGATAGYDPTTRAYSHPSLKDSVAADVRLEDKNADGLVDTLYFVTTGGELWRINLTDMGLGDVDPLTQANIDAYTFNDADPAKWRPYRLTSIGRHQTSGAGSRFDRRFMIQPAVASTRDEDDAYDAIIVGSGDREFPGDTTNVDVMYMYKDAATGKREAPFKRTTGPDGGTPSNIWAADADLPLLDAGMAWVDVNGDLHTPGITDPNDPNYAYPTDPNIQNGWRRQVNDPADGEKVVGGALIIGGIAFFTTYVPKSNSSNPCVPSAGQGRLYALGVGDGDAVFDFIPDNGDPTDPYLALDAPGIPPPAISIGPGPGGGDTDKIYIQGEIVDTETRAFFPTFWRRDEN